MGHAERAVALDPDNTDALELRGTLQYWSWLLGLEPDRVKALALLNRAKLANFMTMASAEYLAQR